MGPPPTTRFLPAMRLVGGRVGIPQPRASRRSEGAWVWAAALSVRRPDGSPRLATLQAQGWSATFCCLTCVAGGWVGELVPLHFCTSSQAGGSFRVTGSVGGLGSTQIQAEPGESRGRGATSLPAVKYPAAMTLFEFVVLLIVVLIMVVVPVPKSSRTSKGSLPPYAAPHPPDRPTPKGSSPQKANTKS